MGDTYHVNALHISYVSFSYPPKLKVDQLVINDYEK